MKSKLSPSAPLNLCPPTGVTNRTVKCVSYFYPTSVNAKRFNLPDGGYDVNLTTFSGEKSKPKTVAGFATKAEAIAHANTLAHPWASWMVGIDSPASPVKDTPADPLEGLNEDEIVLRHAQSWSKAGIPDLGAHLDAPASPVDSVGVPKFSLREDNQSDTVTLLDGDGLRVAQFGSVDFTFDESKRHAQKILASLASHAAKDAKIKSLEEALDGLLDAIHYDAVSFPSSPKAVSTARAALALPCA